MNRFPTLALPFSFLFLALTSNSIAQNNFEVQCSLDPLVTIPSNWALNADGFEKAFPKEKGLRENVKFEWLTKTRDRAVFMRKPFNNVTVDLSLFGGEIRVEEATVDFVDGRINGVTFSILNRADSDKASLANFEEVLKKCGKEVGQRLEVRPFPRRASPNQGMLTEGWTWISAKGMAVLEHNPEAKNGKVEFLRMRVMPRNAKGAMAAAMQSRSGAAVRVSDLPRNVKKDREQNVVIHNLPMVDQGPKGYCVVASAQRLFEYYGIPCDQHQLAQIAGADARSGTSTMAMSTSLGKIDHRFKTRFKPLGMLATTGRLYEPDRQMRLSKEVSYKTFVKHVHSYVDDGIPLLWALELGRFPEVPAISPQANGGHMRMIIGYNDQTEDLVFTDSWGAGHEFKRMKMSDAFKATHGLFVMQPTKQ